MRIAAVAIWAAAFLGGPAGAPSVPAVPVAPEAPSAFEEPHPRFPTADSTGVPDDVILRDWTGPLRTSDTDAPMEVVDGRVCRVFERYSFDLGDSGDYVYADDPCVVFREVRVTTNGAVSNTGAMIQQAADNHHLEVVDSEFDGGPLHVRGVQSNQGDLVVTGSSFTRFGNAGVEMNDRTATFTFTVIGNYLYEPPGWVRDDHIDGIQLGGAGAVTIQGNTVLIEPFGGDPGDMSYVANSALGLWAEVGDVAGPVLVEGNLLAGGGHVMYLQQKESFRFLGRVIVRDNVFDRRFEPLVGIWGPLFPLGLPTDLTWTNNTYEDNSSMGLQAALNGLPHDPTDD